MAAPQEPEEAFTSLSLALLYTFLFRFIHFGVYGRHYNICYTPFFPFTFWLSKRAYEIGVCGQQDGMHDQEVSG
jgi:hypothetical protein